MGGGAADTIRAVDKVLLLGYFGAGNFGDDALLAGWLLHRRQWLKDQGLAADVTVSGEFDPLDGFQEGAAVADCVDSLVPKRAALKLDARSYRALIAPGGSLLQDATSVRSLLYYLMVIRRFLVARRPVFMLNQGIGPLSSWLGSFLTPRYLRGVKLLSLRDQDSFGWTLKRQLRSGGAAVLASCDPMLDPPFSPAAEALRPADDGPYSVVIAKPTRDLPHPGDDTPEEEALGSLVRQVRRTAGSRVLLLGVHELQDRPFCERAAAAAGDCAENCALPPGRGRYNALLGLIAGAQLVVSYRLHGLVCAAAYGVPALGVAYDPKVMSFCDEMALPFCFPATVHEDDAHEDLRRLWQARDEVVEVMAERRGQLLASLGKAEEKFDELW